MNALALDTASDVVTLVVARDRRLVAQHQAPAGRQTNSALLTSVDQLLREAGLRPRDLDLLIAARGPGSFTGIRSGLALLQTFAEVLAVPIVGLDTMHLLALQVEAPRFVVALNCFRRDVFTQAFTRDGGQPVATGPIQLCDIESLPDLVGDQPVLLRRFVQRRPVAIQALDRLTQLPEPAIERAGVVLLEEGFRLYDLRDQEPLPPAVPLYIKPEVSG